MSTSCGIISRTLLQRCRRTLDWKKIAEKQNETDWSLRCIVWRQRMHKQTTKYVIYAYTLIVLSRQHQRHQHKLTWQFDSWCLWCWRHDGGATTRSTSEQLAAGQHPSQTGYFQAIITTHLGEKLRGIATWKILSRHRHHRHRER